MKKTVTRTVMILVIMLLAVSSLGGIGVAAAGILKNVYQE